jgi:hypothetical protein
MFSADVPIWMQNPVTLSDHLWTLLGYIVALLASIWFTRWVWRWDREWWWLALGAAGCVVFFFLAVDAAGDVLGCVFRIDCWIEPRNRF